MAAFQKADFPIAVNKNIGFKEGLRSKQQLSNLMIMFTCTFQTGLTIKMTDQECDQLYQWAEKHIYILAAGGGETAPVTNGIQHELI